MFLDYDTTWDLWVTIELQIFDLSSMAASLKQNKDTIEEYYGKLTTTNIDRRMPNPMKHSEDVTIFNNYIQTQRLYKFLVGIDESFDKECKDSINQTPLPSLDKAYATIRREVARCGIMVHASSSRPYPS